jgi:presenilin-like A22 family membrane protease
MARWFDERFTALAMGFVFVVTILLGMLLAFPFMDMGYQAFEDPESLWIPLMYIIMILIFTGIVLFLAKKGHLGLIQGLVLFAMGMALMYVLFVPYGYGFWYLAGDLVYDSEYRNALDVLTLLFSVGTAGFLTYLLYRHPEWYVRPSDSAGGIRRDIRLQDKAHDQPCGHRGKKAVARGPGHAQERGILL